MKFTITADDHEALIFGAECCFDFVNAGHKLCGYADNQFFASVRKTKHGANATVDRKAKDNSNG